MTAVISGHRRAYSMHGLTVDVVADDPAVAAQMDMRLRGFAWEPDPADPPLRFEFVAGPPAAAPTGPGRPVYETPYGPLHYFADDDLLAGEFAGVALRCESGLGRTVIAAPAFRGSALYLATHPLATVALMEMMERRGRFALHAGCLATADGSGVLLAGPSGAGKSTLTLALARAGMEFLGDDVVFIERLPRGDLGGHVAAQVGPPGMSQEPGLSTRAPHGPGARLRALGFADTIGLGTFAAERFPEFAAAAAEPPADGFPKRLHRFEELFPRRPVPSCEPRAIIFPEVAPDRASAITPLDGGEALLRLVPDVLVTHAEATRAHVAAIAALVEQVRCYAVRSGSDLERAADLVHALV